MGQRLRLDGLDDAEQKAILTVCAKIRREYNLLRLGWTYEDVAQAGIVGILKGRSIRNQDDRKHVAFSMKCARNEIMTRLFPRLIRTPGASARRRACDVFHSRRDDFRSLQAREEREPAPSMETAHRASIFLNALTDRQKGSVLRMLQFDGHARPAYSRECHREYHIDVTNYSRAIKKLREQNAPWNVGAPITFA
jgi:DNA-directed RNA polymerase specialized sigma24 family protein